MTTRLHDQVRRFLRERNSFFEVNRRQDLVDPLPDSPRVPSTTRLRLALLFVVEETFELVEACCADKHDLDLLETAHSYVTEVIGRLGSSTVDLVELADACGDIDYVVEGLRQVCGIDGEPIADEISEANLAKFAPGVRFREDGKLLKPDGWEPPNIRWELHKQGWKGEE